MKTGQDLVAAGYAGLAGSRMIVAARKSQLESRYSADYLNQLERFTDPAEILLPPGDWTSLGATAWEASGHGGILAAVWNLSGRYRLGVDFSLRQIPLLQGTIEVCEQFGLNPYRLYSSGCWLLTCDNGGRTVQTLSEQKIAAAVIGTVIKGIARMVRVGGEQGYLNRPQPDELQQVIPNWKELVTVTEIEGGNPL